MVKLEAVLKAEKIFFPQRYREEKDSGEIKVKLDYGSGLYETVVPAAGIILGTSYTLNLLMDLYKSF